MEAGESKMENWSEQLHLEIRKKRYIVKSLDRDGCYLLCFESATGEVNAVMMIVLYDENNMPLYEFNRKLSTK